MHFLASHLPNICGVTGLYLTSRLHLLYAMAQHVICFLSLGGRSRQLLQPYESIQRADTFKQYF